MNPKVSVIIPVYNTEQYIAECLDSVVNQTLKDIEIIIINDKSPDNSMSIIREYAKCGRRVIIIDKPVNEGVGQARNDGLAKATGEFVCFIDSDDLYSDNTVLEKLYSAAKTNQVNAAGGMLELKKEDTLELQSYPKTEYSLTFNQTGLMNYLDYQYDYGYTQYIFSRQMIIDNQILFPRHSRFQDPPFFVKAMFAAKEYFFVDEPVYRYRLIASSSKYTIKKTIDMLEGVMDNLKFSRENGLVKLHCLSAHRLNTEGSFMAIQNLYSEENEKLLAKLIEANQAVDVKWLKENGYKFKEPFVLDVFKYAVNTAEKYENLRNKRFIKPIRKILGK